MKSDWQCISALKSPVTVHLDNKQSNYLICLLIPLQGFIPVLSVHYKVFCNTHTGFKHKNGNVTRRDVYYKAHTAHYLPLTHKTKSVDTGKYNRNEAVSTLYVFILYFILSFSWYHEQIVHGACARPANLLLAGLGLVRAYEGCMEMPPYEIFFPSLQMHFAPSNDPCSSMVGFLGSCYLDHCVLLRTIYVGKIFMIIESNQT